MRHVVEKIVSEEGEGELWLKYYVRGTPPIFVDFGGW